MYNGYLALGEGTATLPDDRFELVNTNRVSAYIQTWNDRVRQGTQEGGCIDWYDDCDSCASSDLLFTDGEGYLWPSVDQAPWYDPAVRDSDRFFGVVGLEVTGAEDSTRSATVKASVTGGGAVSRLRFGPRTIVVRGLAVAADSCGLEVGLNWLRCQYETTIDECGNDYLWFLDCCPNCTTDPNAPSVSPCWPETYGELKSPWTMECGGAWTPTTYADLENGPPDFTTSGWCAWATIYRTLRLGLPQYSCDIQECLEPYMRNFQQTRVVEGPIVLSRYAMHGQGEIAEIEFTIACGDPHEYTPAAVAVSEGLIPGGAVTDQLEPERPDNPFFPGRTPAPVGPGLGIEMPTEWKRASVPFAPERRTALPGLVPAIAVHSEQAMGVTRVGVWDGDEVLGGFVLPFVPAGGLVSVDAVRRAVVTEYEGEEATANGFARNYKGKGSVTWPELEAGGDYVITFDQDADLAVPFVVEVQAAEKGCA